MEEKFVKFNEDIELGKQRENKLMFFLYVLKEEKKCPVTEVFNDYIKPIETSRFTTEYGEDYRKVLKKIKKQTKYEKIYNRALKKMRLLNGGKNYKSDSCLPIQTSMPFEDGKKKKSYTPPPNLKKFEESKKAFNLKKVIRVKNRNKTI